MKGPAQKSSGSASRPVRRPGNSVCLEKGWSTANVVDQDTSRDVPGGFDVVGIAITSASVTVNSADVDYRRGECFRKQVTGAMAKAHKWMQNQKQQQAQKGIK